MERSDDRQADVAMLNEFDEEGAMYGAPEMGKIGLETKVINEKHSQNA